MHPPFSLRSSSSLVCILTLSVLCSTSSAFSLTPSLPALTSSFRKTSVCQHANARLELGSANRISLRAVSGVRHTSLAAVSGVRRATCSGAEPASIDVIADDGHAIKVWSKGSKDGEPIVLLHGRTWSARPVWDLQVIVKLKVQPKLRQPQLVFSHSMLDTVACP
eukprot:853922-Rhodomonas_salina.1